MADVDAFCPQPITVSSILSYCGSSLDLGINYSLLVINLLTLGALHRRLRSIATIAMNDSSSSSARTHRPPSLGSSALLSLGFGESSLENERVKTGREIFACYTTNHHFDLFLQWTIIRSPLHLQSSPFRSFSAYLLGVSGYRLFGVQYWDGWCWSSSRRSTLVCCTDVQQGGRTNRTNHNAESFCNCILCDHGSSDNDCCTSTGNFDGRDSVCGGKKIREGRLFFFFLGREIIGNTTAYCC